METPVTPKKARPTLIRSHTDTPPKRPASQPAQQQSKKYHLDLFSHSQHSHHTPFHRSQAKDKYGSKTNLRQQLQNPIDGISQIVTGGDASQNASRRGSKDAYGDVPALRIPQRPIRAVDLDREKQKGRLREEELRTSLNKLSDTAHNSTRRLDFAYYSLLEKARTLRSTIANLQELSTATNELQENFQRDSANVGNDTQKQIDAFADFADQHERVQDLESRIKGGMTKADNLNARLEAARTRVETWEAREKKWQAQTSKRLTICWCCLVVFSAFIVLLLIIRRVTAPVVPKVDVDYEWAKNRSLPSFIIEDLAEISSSRLLAKSTASPTGPVTLAGDRRLRGFEEL